MFLTSKLVSCFIDGFTSGMKSQSIAYLLLGSAHIYWILDLEGEVHSIWDLQSSGLQECKGNVFFEVGRVGQQFSVGSKFSWEGCPRPDMTPQSSQGGTLCPPCITSLAMFNHLCRPPKYIHGMLQPSVGETQIKFEYELGWDIPWLYSQGPRE